jgi:CheY-like chemotaxis protein
MLEHDAAPHDPGSDEGPASIDGAQKTTRKLRARPRILVVEDDALMRESVVELLRSEGYRVAAAANGKEAIELLSPEARIDLVLLDLLLPVKTGWDVLSHVEATHAKLPVLVLTGSGLKQGAVGNHTILAKDVGYDALLASVKSLLR